MADPVTTEPITETNEAKVRRKTNTFPIFAV